MGLPRQRTRFEPDSVGSRTLYGSTQVFVRGEGLAYCEDVIHSRGTANALYISREIQSGGRLNGYRFDPFYGVYLSWDNQPMFIASSNYTPESFSMDEVTAAIRAYNITNPSRHDLSLVTSAVELRDLPDMLRFAGRILYAPPDLWPMIKNMLHNATLDPRNPNFYRGLTPGDIARMFKWRVSLEQQGGLSALQALAAANLTWQFGWRPIISDMQKLMNLESSVDRRMEELKRLHSGRGLKRRISLQDSPKQYSGSVPVDSLGGIIDIQFNVQCSTKIWATVRWKPDDPTRAYIPLRQDVKNVMLGLDLHGILASAWELLPWSWLADWCGNLGDLIDSTSNSLGAHATVCVMRHDKAVYTAPDVTVDFGVDYTTGASLGYKHFTSYRHIKETKTRRVSGSPVLSDLRFSFPILSESQLSILGSIAMLFGGR